MQLLLGRYTRVTSVGFVATSVLAFLLLFILLSVGPISAPTLHAYLAPTLVWYVSSGVLINLLLRWHPRCSQHPWLGMGNLFPKLLQGDHLFLFRIAMVAQAIISSHFFLSGIEVFHLLLLLVLLFSGPLLRALLLCPHWMGPYDISHVCPRKLASTNLALEGS